MRMIDRRKWHARSRDVHGLLLPTKHGWLSSCKRNTPRCQGRTHRRPPSRPESRCRGGCTIIELLPCQRSNAPRRSRHFGSVNCPARKIRHSLMHKPEWLSFHSTASSNLQHSSSTKRYVHLPSPCRGVVHYSSLVDRELFCRRHLKERILKLVAETMQEVETAVKASKYVTTREGTENIPPKILFPIPANVVHGQLGRPSEVRYLGIQPTCGIWGSVLSIDVCLWVGMATAKKHVRHASLALIQV